MTGHGRPRATLRETLAARLSSRGAVVLAFALLVGATGLACAPTLARLDAAADAAGPREAVIEIAHSYLGTPYRLGAESRAFVDCSGLIYRVFADAGQLPLIGGRRRRAIGYYGWFQNQGMTTTDIDGGARGDLVYYRSDNSRSSHIGFYLGNGSVLSALTTDVAVHGMYALEQSRFVSFLRVNWSAADDDALPPPTPTRAPSTIRAAWRSGR
jgi:NlpC/P60 family